MNGDNRKRNLRPLVGILLVLSLTGWILSVQAQRQGRDYALLKALQETRELHPPGKTELDAARVRAVTDKIHRLLNEGADPNLYTSESHWGDLFHSLLPWPRRGEYESDSPGIPALHFVLYRPSIMQETPAGSVTKTIRDDALVRSLMEIILAKGGDLEARDKNDGMTPLMTAAASDYVDTVELLLDRGADINAQDDTGRTALMQAVDAPRTWRLLLKRGANILLSDNEGNTALHTAATGDNAEMVRALIARKAQVNARNYWKQTPLHNAANRSLNTIQTLLKAGADINARDEPGHTPLYYARSQDIATLRLFFDAGTDRAARQEDGGVLLMDAVRESKLPIVRLLLQHGADVNTTDYRGSTALTYALGQPDARITRLLKKAGAK